MAGYPLLYSSLENLMGRGAWLAAVHRVTQSRTQLKWLKSNSMIFRGKWIFIFSFLGMWHIDILNTCFFVHDTAFILYNVCFSNRMLTTPCIFFMPKCKKYKQIYDLFFWILKCLSGQFICKTADFFATSERNIIL